MTASVREWIDFSLASAAPPLLPLPPLLRPASERASCPPAPAGAEAGAGARGRARARGRGGGGRRGRPRLEKAHAHPDGAVVGQSVPGMTQATSDESTHSSSVSQIVRVQQ